MTLKSMGQSEERRIEERLYALEEGQRSAAKAVTDLGTTMVAGFSSTHKRLDEGNGTAAKLAERVGKLEDAELIQLGAHQERAKWEARAATNLKWLFGAGMMAAGVTSGVVFKLIEYL